MEKSFEDFVAFFQNPHVLSFFNTTGTFITIMVGAMLLYLVASNNGVSIKDGISRLIRDKSDLYYDRMEFFIFVFVGAFVGEIVFQPQTYYSALAAGFGWVGGLSTLINNRSSPPLKQDNPLLEPNSPVSPPQNPGADPNA